MQSTKKKQQHRVLRKNRIRSVVTGLIHRPRLSVFRSSKHIYAQVIDDVTGKTLASASSQKLSEPGVKTDMAVLVGKLCAESALKAGIKEVVIDRGGYRYHGRVKALADAAREGGLIF